MNNKNEVIENYGGAVLPEQARAMVKMLHELRRGYETEDEARVVTAFRLVGELQRAWLGPAWYQTTGEADTPTARAWEALRWFAEDLANGECRQEEAYGRRVRELFLWFPELPVQQHVLTGVPVDAARVMAALEGWKVEEND